MNKKLHILLIVLAFGMTISIAQESDHKDTDSALPPLVEKELERKLDKFKQTILNKCRKEAIEKAELFVDSIVAEEVKLLAGDTLLFPSKPIRPALPEKIILNDSTGIAPIIDE